jgi:rhomboid protease GluP
MFLGWKIQYEKRLPAEGINNWEVFCIAAESCKELEWDFLVVDEKTFTATTPTQWTLSEEVITITIENDEIIFKSQSENLELYEAGRNQKNIEEYFLPVFEKIKKRLGSSELASAAVAFKNKTLQQLSSGSRVASEHVSFGFKGHEVTLFFMLANAAMFIVMAYNGVDIYDPSPQDITRWGGNVREFVKAGDWWRLLSNLFVHLGIYPLLINLFGLYFIGLMVETILGKLKFLIAYIVTGSLASLASIYFLGGSVTAGASGAIAGLYGVLIAFATTPYINKKFNWFWLSGIAVYVLLNLWMSIEGGIDTVANWGGLVAGMCVGYLFYYFHFRRNHARAGGTRISVEIMLIAAILVYLYIRDAAKKRFSAV